MTSVPRLDYVYTPESYNKAPETTADLGNFLIPGHGHGPSVKAIILSHIARHNEAYVRPFIPQTGFTSMPHLQSPSMPRTPLEVAGGGEFAVNGVGEGGTGRLDVSDWMDAGECSIEAFSDGEKTEAGPGSEEEFNDDACGERCQMGWGDSLSSREIFDGVSSKGVARTDWSSGGGGTV